MLLWWCFAAAGVVAKRSRIEVGFQRAVKKLTEQNDINFCQNFGPMLDRFGGPWKGPSKCKCGCGMRGSWLYCQILTNTLKLSSWGPFASLQHFQHPICCIISCASWILWVLGGLRVLLEPLGSLLGALGLLSGALRSSLWVS